LVFLALGMSAIKAEAQTPSAQLELRISKVNGFNLGGQIQGRFRLWASGPADLQNVEFIINGESIGGATASPFGIAFNTGSFELGRHVLWAVGTTSTGESQESPRLTLEFVSPDSARLSTLKIIVPVLGITLAISVLAIIGPLLGGGGRRRDQNGAYGIAGGAVCRRCGLPFSRHILRPSFLGVRLERCPHCGAWLLAARANPGQLGEAEARLRGQHADTRNPTGGEDSLRRMIEDSRFEE